MPSSPAPPPRNPFLADSNLAVVHANSAQTDPPPTPVPAVQRRRSE